MKRNQNSRLLLNINRAICYVVLVLISILCLFSFYLLIVNASRPHAAIMSEISFVPGNYLFKNLVNLLNDPNIPMLWGLLNSFIVAGGCALLSTYFSAMTAFGLYAYDFRLKNLAFCFIMFIMMVPTQVSALGFIQLVTKMKMMDTFYPLIIPSIAAPVVFFYMKQYMESVVPLEIIEAARCDGSNEFRTFNRIVLPVIKPAIAVQGIFTFVQNWNNYFVPSLIINSDKMKTVPILIAQLRSADYMKFDLGQVYIMIFVAIVPLMIVYIFLSKFIIKGLTLGSVKG